MSISSESSLQLSADIHQGFLTGKDNNSVQPDQVHYKHNYDFLDSKYVKYSKQSEVQETPANFNPTSTHKTTAATY